MKKPERMCIACRKTSGKDNFIKIVKNKNGQIKINEICDGRGAYICKDNRCIEKVIKNKLLNRNYKCNISEEVYENLKCVINKE